MPMKYTHAVSVEVRGEAHVVQIHRVIDGRIDLYSEIDLPSVSVGEPDWDSFEKISAWLGKAICIDSQDIRRCLGIDAAANRSTVASGDERQAAVPSFQVQAFIDRGGVLEPFFLSISAPVPSKDAEEFYCEVHAPTLLKRNAEILGVDAAQAHALAIKFIKSMLGDARLVDDGRHPVDW